uniref:Uncharacterized protein n=1 Tax=Physcomitrium patens TaxID=3218 RepID=A0A2K1JPW5_PHYPA|nr:hypothetical protein PHYPA_015837 [Physcomitrium patens]
MDEEEASKIFHFLWMISLITKILFLFDITARHIQKYQNLCPRVIWLVNNNNIVIVSHTNGNTTCAILLHVMLDFKAHPVMIDKQLVKELCLAPTYMEPFFFTIVTSIGSKEQATSYTK